MLSKLSRNWWLVALQGLSAVIFGVLALVWPQSALWALVMLFGAFALVDGAFALVQAVAWRKLLRRWWAVALGGLAGIATGILTFVWPNITGLALLYMIAVWAIVTGIFEIVAAIELRQVIDGEWLMVLNGLLSVVFGVLLVVFPGSGALALVWLIAAFAIVSGIMLIVLAFRMHNWANKVDKAVEQIFQS